MRLYYFLVPILFLFTFCEDKDPNPYIDKKSDIPTSLSDGINKISDDSLGFVLYAPGKTSVHLIGDFNNWQVSDTYKMKKDGDRFWIKIGNLEKGKEYVCQYYIDNSIRVADPYATKISDPWNDKYITSSTYPNLIAYPSSKTTEIAMVVNTDRSGYSWKVKNFKLDNPDQMVIYELLIRDFTESRTIKAAKEKIPYLKNLGVNAIELMPFNEFEGNESWGYNPSFYFATDKAYGTSNDYKDFIDACHQNGIAVIMDMVFNHSYGQSPMVRMYQDPDGTVSANNPWYNKKSNFANPSAQWGYDFNHESTATKSFIDSVCAYWMKEYKIDGFRLDFTKGFSNTPFPASGDNEWGDHYDAARIKNLKRLYAAVKKQNSDVIFICEHLAENQEQKELADYGILLWGNMNGNYMQLAMGWDNNNIDWTSYKQRGWSNPNLIAYMESHDEERVMFKNLQWGNSKEAPVYNVKDLNTALKRTEAAAVLFLTIPGPKMIWQFGELGYDYSINSRSDGTWSSDFGEEYRLAPKKIRWDYFEVPARKSLYTVYSQMNKMRNENPIFATRDYTIKENDLFKQVLLRSSNGNVSAIANLNVVPVSEVVTFEKLGEWEDYFTKDKINVTSATMTIELQPGEYRLYMSK